MFKSQGAGTSAESGEAGGEEGLVARQHVCHPVDPLQTLSHLRVVQSFRGLRLIT